jgi:hypothetical protein
VTWDRQSAAAAVTQALQVTLGETTWVYPAPPQTVNPPAVVVGRPAGVRFAEVAFGIDMAELPVVCVAAADGEDQAARLVGLVRQSFPDPTLGGAVLSCVAVAERNWRNVTIAGVDLLQVEVVLDIRM